MHEFEKWGFYVILQFLKPISMHGTRKHQLERVNDHT